jgi:putative acetyltransferase
MLYEFQKPWMGKIGGYFALSRMQGPEGGACLAPMAVRPEWQGGKLAEAKPNMGVGGSKDEANCGPWRFGTLMLQHLQAYYDIQTEEIQARLPTAIVVLGKPSFYGRWGFSLEQAQKLRSPYPLEYTLILQRGEEVPEETLI